MKPALIYYKENVFSQLDYFQNIRLAIGHRTKRFFQWSGKMGERL